MFWHKYGMQVTGTSLGTALLGTDAYDDRLKTSAALLIRFILDFAEAQGINLTGVVWSRSLTGIHMLTLASGARELRAEFANEQLAEFQARDTASIRRALRAMVEELGADLPQLAPESAEKYMF